MEPRQHSLVNILSILYQRSRFIILITLLSIAAAAVLHISKPKKYEAKTVFILKNPLYADRNFLYNNETKFIDYFASEDDIDKFMLMAESDSFQNKVINDMRLADAYKYDTSNEKKALRLKQAFARNLNIVRTDKKSLTLSYTDKDPKRAAQIANLSVILLEKALRGFYNDIRASMYQSIMAKVQEEDSAINNLTDTLVKLRDEYGIYDIISPSRYNIMLSSIKPNGHKDFARGLETIQNIESIKDQLVADKARHISLVNQYTTGTKVNDLPLTRIIQIAKKPVKAKGPGIVMTMAAAGFAGFFFSLLFVLFTGFYRRYISQ